MNKSGNTPFVPEPASSSSATMDGEDPMDLDTPTTPSEPVIAPRIDIPPRLAINKVDIEDVACGCLLKLKCKPGVTESLLNEITQSIETVVNGVLFNLKTDVTELFNKSEANYNPADTAAVISLIDDASDPLASLSTTYRLKSVTQTKYPAVVSG